MANKKPWLDSDGILAAIKRKITLPDSQELLTDEEILAFCNEEMMVSMVPSILSYHEEFFVTRMLEGGSDEQELTASLSRYSIPSRAIGSRLRDLFYQDSNGNLSEMTRINPDDRVFFNSNGQETSDNFSKFYLEGNDIVLIPSVGTSPTGSLVCTYFLRPNQLVDVDRAATIQSFKKTITVSLSTLVSGNTVTINDEVFTAGTDFAIGVTDTATGTNLAAAITSNGVATAANVSGVVSCLFSTPDITITTSNSTAFTIQSTLTLVCEATIPTHIVAGELVDLIQTAGGHQSRAIGIPVVSVSGSSITFTDALVPDTMVVGDYICIENECIIPQIPSDLHIDLVERAGSRILAAIGDVTGLQIASAKIQENRANQGILIDNRVDGSPQKIVNRSGFLSRNKKRWF